MILEFSRICQIRCFERTLDSPLSNKRVTRSEVSERASAFAAKQDLAGAL